MTVATKEQLAAKLAQAIYEEIATPLFRAQGARVAGLPQPPDHAGDDRRSPRRVARLQLPPRARGTRRRRDAREALPAPGGAVRGAQAARMPGLRRVPGGTRARPQPAGHDARRVPDPAGRRPRLPRKQAQHDARSLQRRQRAVLAQREADGARRDRARGLRPLHPRAVRGDRPPGRPGCRRRGAVDHAWSPLRDAGALLRAVGGDRATSPSGRRRARCGDRTRTAGRERALHADLGPGVARAASCAPGARRRAARLGDERGVPRPPRPAGRIERPARARRAVGRRGRAPRRAPARIASASPSWPSGSSASAAEEGLGVLAHVPQHRAPVPERSPGEEAARRSAGPSGGGRPPAGRTSAPSRPARRGSARSISSPYMRKPAS